MTSVGEKIKKEKGKNKKEDEGGKEKEILGSESDYITYRFVRLLCDIYILMR